MVEQWIHTDCWSGSGVAKIGSIVMNIRRTLAGAANLVVSPF